MLFVHFLKRGSLFYFRESSRDITKSGVKRNCVISLGAKNFFLIYSLYFCTFMGGQFKRVRFIYNITIGFAAAVYDWDYTRDSH